MNYYETKKKAFKRINELYADGASLDVIKYKVSMEFGFGDKFIVERINLLDTMRDIQERENKVKKIQEREDEFDTMVK